MPQFPLAYRGEPLLCSPLGNRYEQTQRPRPRHTRPAPPENSGAAAFARVGHQSSPEIYLWRRAAGQRKIPLPGIAQTGAGRLDHGRVEADGEQPASEVLFAHPSGQKATGIGGRKLASAVVRHLACHSAFRGLEIYADGTLVVHGALAAEVYSAPRPGGPGAR